MAEIPRPNYDQEPVKAQRTATAAVLIDPATGHPYNGNTGVVTPIPLSEVPNNG